MDIPRDEQHTPGWTNNAMPPSRERSSRGALSTERLAQIRERLREGAYDSVAVREATARGLLGRGDLDQGEGRR